MKEGTIGKLLDCRQFEFYHLCMIGLSLPYLLPEGFQHGFRADLRQMSKELGCTENAFGTAEVTQASLHTRDCLLGSLQCLLIELCQLGELLREELHDPVTLIAGQHTLTLPHLVESSCVHNRVITAQTIRLYTSFNSRGSYLLVPPSIEVERREPTRFPSLARCVWFERPPEAHSRTRGSTARSVGGRSYLRGWKDYLQGNGDTYAIEVPRKMTDSKNRRTWKADSSLESSERKARTNECEFSHQGLSSNYYIQYVKPYPEGGYPVSNV